MRKTDRPSNYERRDYRGSVELRQSVEGESETSQIVGYAAVFGARSEKLDYFTEEIAPGAFTETIAEDDIRALGDHEPTRILGRTKPGTLRLSEDKVGLRYEIDLPDTSVGRDVRESISRGDVDGSSFGFIAIDEEWSRIDGQEHRKITKARLFDVGPVTFPAYPDTAVAIRSLEAWRQANKPESADTDASDDLGVNERKVAEIGVELSQ